MKAVSAWLCTRGIPKTHSDSPSKTYINCPKNELNQTVAGFYVKRITNMSLSATLKISRFRFTILLSFCTSFSLKHHNKKIIAQKSHQNFFLSVFDNKKARSESGLLLAFFPKILLKLGNWGPVLGEKSLYVMKGEKCVSQKFSLFLPLFCLVCPFNSSFPPPYFRPLPLASVSSFFFFSSPLSCLPSHHPNTTGRRLIIHYHPT